MRRADFFLLEAVRALRNNLATTVAATVTVLIVLYFLGVFVLFGTYLYAKVDKERSGVRVTVYLDKRASDQQVKSIGARLRQNPDVKPNAVEYVSKAEAWQRLKERVPKTVWESVLTNPLPASWEASLENPDRARTWRPRCAACPASRRAPNGVQVRRPGRRPPAAQCRRRRGGDRRAHTHPRDLGRGADRQHHPAVDLRAPARGRGDEAGGRLELVRAPAVRARGHALRPRRRRALDRACWACRSCCCRITCRLRRSTRTARMRSRSGCSRRSCCSPGRLLGAIGSGVTMRRFLRV